MPEIRTYTVTQVREISVTANSVEDAVAIALFQLRPGQPVPTLEVWGRPNGEVKETDLNVKRTS